MGSLFTSKLQLTGRHNVCVLSKFAHSSIPDHRLTFKPFASPSNYPNSEPEPVSLDVQVARDSREALKFMPSKADFVLICVKGRDATQRAAHQASNLLKESGVALTLQNGVGNYEILCESLGKSRSLVGITSNGARIDGPGQVAHTGHGEMQIVEMDPEGETHRALSDSPTNVGRGVCDIMKSAGFTVNLKPWSSKDSVLWHKLMVNAAINPITAILRVKNGKIARNKMCRRLAIQLIHEFLQVAAANNIDVFAGRAESQPLSERETTEYLAQEIRDTLLLDTAASLGIRFTRSPRRHPVARAVLPSQNTPPDQSSSIDHASSSSKSPFSNSSKVPMDSLVRGVRDVFIVSRKTDQNRSSMLSDIERNQETEIDSITGPVLEAAAKLALVAPANDAIFSLIKILEGTTPEGF